MPKNMFNVRHERRNEKTHRSVVDNRLNLLLKINDFSSFAHHFLFTHQRSTQTITFLTISFRSKKSKKFSAIIVGKCPLAVFCAIATCVTINRFTFFYFFCYNCAQLLKINYFTSESSKRERFPSNENFFSSLLVDSYVKISL